MNNKIKMILTFTALFFALSSQSGLFSKQPQNLDLLSGGNLFVNDVIKMTKNIKLEPEKYFKNSDPRFLYKSGSCVVISNAPHIQYDKKFHIQKIHLRRHVSGDWRVKMNATKEPFKLQSIQIKCLVPNKNKSIVNVNTDHIKKTSNGLIIFDTVFI